MPVISNNAANETNVPPSTGLVVALPEASSLANEGATVSAGETPLYSIYTFWQNTKHWIAASLAAGKWDRLREIHVAGATLPSIAPVSDSASA
jgi:hypothetical protein